MLGTTPVKNFITSDKGFLLQAPSPLRGGRGFWRRHKPPAPIFTALTRSRSNDEKAVCPSVSVKYVHCDKTDERSVELFIPYERSFSLVFEKKNGWWGQLLLPEIFGQPSPVGAKLPIIKRYFLVTPQP